MIRWTVEVIPAAEREIKALPDDLQGKFLHVAGLLQEFGPARVKNAQKTPRREIASAERRMEQQHG